MQNYYYLMLIVVAIIFGNIAWMIYKDIKEAKGEDRKKKILIFSSIGAVCLLLYAGLRIFAAQPLSDLYYWLAGVR